MKKSYRRILSVGLFVVLIGGLVFALSGCGFLNNKAPTADIVTDPAATAGTVARNVGDSIEFNGSGSADPDGTIVAYDWDFDSNFDRKTAIGAKIQTGSYTSIGTYTVTLKVTDDGGAAAQDTVKVEVS